MNADEMTREQLEEIVDRANIMLGTLVTLLNRDWPTEQCRACLNAEITELLAETAPMAERLDALIDAEMAELAEAEDYSRV
jgi:hypothetical protein